MKFPLKLKGTFGELIQAFIVVFGISMLLGSLVGLLDGAYTVSAIAAAIGVVVLYVFYPREPKSGGS